jgi:hypothetical protein
MEMIRRALPRGVQTITTIRLFSFPALMYRNSP